MDTVVELFELLLWCWLAAERSCGRNDGTGICEGEVEHGPLVGPPDKPERNRNNES